MKQAQRAFTLIELMIVVAIVGILTATALPIYLDYTVRSRVAELVVLGANARTMVGENIANSGNTIDSASCNGVSNLTGLTSNTASLTCSTGVLIVTGTGRAKAVALTYTPTIGGSGTVNWTCTTPPANQRYVPGECR